MSEERREGPPENIGPEEFAQYLSAAQMQDHARRMAALARPPSPPETAEANGRPDPAQPEQPEQPEPSPPETPTRPELRPQVGPAGIPFTPAPTSPTMPASQDAVTNGMRDIIIGLSIGMGIAFIAAYLILRKESSVEEKD